jgi:hypothetical protein
LRLRRELREQVTDPSGDRAADACVGLVEDETGQVTALQRRHLRRGAIRDNSPPEATCGSRGGCQDWR